MSSGQPLRVDHSIGRLATLQQQQQQQQQRRPQQPVATVLPLKRPLLLPERTAEKCRGQDETTTTAAAPPPAKAACRLGAGGIATNPRCRRRSRDRCLLPPVTMATAATACLPTPVTRDAQTSPLRTPPQQQQQQQQGCSRTPRPLLSAGGWAKSAKKRLAHIRRSLSSSRLQSPGASPTPPGSSLSPSSRGVGGCGTPRRARRRQSSLQRLVQRFAPSPKSLASAPAGCVLALHRDGSRTVLLHRPHGHKFGFFVARNAGGVYLTRFNDATAQSRYLNLVSVGDKILKVEDSPTDDMELGDIHARIADRRKLTMRVLPMAGGGFHC